MTAPVDVLAVMASVWNRGLDETNVHEFEEARAAVAELIEAAEYGREWIIEVGDRKGYPNGGTLKIIDAALARVKGGAQ